VCVCGQVVEDKTFGLKNKNKSKMVQKFVAEVCLLCVAEYVAVCVASCVAACVAVCVAVCGAISVAVCVAAHDNLRYA